MQTGKIKQQMKNKLLSTAAVLTALTLTAQGLSADVFDFSGAAPVYDANRSTTATGSGVHYYEDYMYNPQVGFNWSNSQYSGVWYYSWDGINVSNCADKTVDISKYWEAGQLGQYTSVTGTDGSGVAGGYYGIYYGNTSANLGYSSSDMAQILFSDLINVSSIQLANTLVSYDYLTKTLTEEGNYHSFKVLIYAIDSMGEFSENFIECELSNADTVTNSWIDVDLSSLNEAEGIYGLYFKTLTDDYGEWGANAPSYFAMDNLTYSSAAVPEPSTYAAIFGALALALAIYRRRK